MIESLLLLLLGIGMWTYFSKQVKASGWFNSMISAPWQSLSGMIESGVWGPSQKVRTQHPNQFYRVRSPDKT